MQKLSIFTSPKIIKTELKNWKPNTKSEAIRAIHVMSIVNSAATNIKRNSYDFLKNRCANCANHIDTDTGLEVLKVEPNKKIWNSSERIVQLEQTIMSLTKELKLERQKAGHTLEAQSIYFKAIMK